MVINIVNISSVLKLFQTHLFIRCTVKNKKRKFPYLDKQTSYIPETSTLFVSPLKVYIQLTNLSEKNCLTNCQSNNGLRQNIRTQILCTVPRYSP